MREIKFRGKNKDLGWVYGQLTFDINGNAYIIQNVEMDSSYGLEETMLFATMWYRVDKNTIGQYIGLHDKNGKEIYEGNIVSKETFDDTKPNYRDISYAKVVWIKELASYHLVNKDDKILWDLAADKYNIEVAGNIYENSDLLKGADNIE